MSVIVSDNEMFSQKPLRIAFAGASFSGRSTLANLCYNKLVKDGKEVMKLSIEGPIKLIAKKKYGSNSRKDWMMIGMEVRAVNQDHWINLLKQRIEDFGPDINIIVDDVKFQNEVGILTTLGFKIVYMDVPWNERFNRMVKKYGTTNPSAFGENAKWFAHESELNLLPNAFYDYRIKIDEDKYKIFDIEFNMNKNEVVELEKSKQLNLV